MNTSSILKPIINNNEKLYLYNVMINNEFKQLERANNEIKLGMSLWFTDDINTPSIVFSFQLLDALIKVYSNGKNLDKVASIIESIDWSKGFLNNFDIPQLNEIINNVKYDSAIQYHCKNDIKSLTLPELDNEVIIEMLKKELIKHNYNVTLSDTFNEYSFKVDEIDNVNESIKQYESYLDGNEIILNHVDAAFAYQNWAYKTEFSFNEFKWSVDNKLSFGYKVNDDEGNSKLVCWNIIKSDGKSTHFHTLPEYRSKGYAKIVRAKVYIECLKRNISVISYIQLTNTTAQTLNKNMGFKQRDLYCRILQANK